MAENFTLVEKNDKADILIVPLIKANDDFFERLAKFFSKETADRLKRGIQNRKFSVKPNAVLELDDGERTIAVVGVSRGLSAAEALETGAFFFRQAKKLCQADVFIPKEVSSRAAEFLLGMELEAYSFDKYKTKKKSEEFSQLEQVCFCFEEGGFNPRKLEEARALAAGVRYARDLGNEPPNVLTPEAFAEDVRRLEYLGLEVEVFEPGNLAENGFSMLSAVGAASTHSPRAVVAKWKGAPSRKDYDLVLVGKGITFDAGGINLKTAAGLKDMKVDMGGAAAVIAALKVQALLKSKLNVAVVVGLAENALGSQAYRPGDILTSASGQTVEIANTDAEGRLALADCLWYAATKLKASRIVDLATLTGASANVFRGHYASIFCRDEALAEALTKAGAVSGEKLWPLPFDREFDKMVDSEIADVKQIGQGMNGSTLAACFLQRFVKDKISWAHLDIAGCETLEKARPAVPSGATGFGVRLLCEYMKSLKPF